MIQTIVIQMVVDEDNNAYEIGDRVRVKMKPSNVDRPELANEHIGWIDDIQEGVVVISTRVGVRKLHIEHIDKIRLAADNESFDNKWDF